MTGAGTVYPMRPQTGDWLDHARCKGTPVDLFFPERGDNQNQIAYAKALCSVCPVREECLQDAIDQRERWGIRGGLTYTERRRMLTGTPPLKPAPAPCGTEAAYKRHLRDGTPCVTCRVGHASRTGGGDAA